MSLDDNRYPSDDQLSAVRNWDYKDADALFEFLQRIWNWPDWGIRNDHGCWFLSTGGWSGNEEIISAMRENFLIWSLCWHRSDRGGQYIFKVPEKIRHKKGTSP